VILFNNSNATTQKYSVVPKSVIMYAYLCRGVKVKTNNLPGVAIEDISGVASGYSGCKGKYQAYLLHWIFISCSAATLPGTPQHICDCELL